MSKKFDPAQLERGLRIYSLVKDRGMTYRAAETVVDAAMFGIGCIEGDVREKIEREKVSAEVHQAFLGGSNG
jgi:hypothetical protein